jgi:hypothetical protein
MNGLSNETVNAAGTCTGKTNGNGSRRNGLKTKRFVKISVIVGGINFLLFGLFHISFWFSPFLDWKNELVGLTQINSNIMQMLNIGISVLLLSFGVIMLSFCSEILYSALGRALLIVSSLFWLARLIGEFVFPGSSIIFGLILLLCVLVYLIPAIILYNSGK